MSVDEQAAAMSEDPYLCPSCLAELPGDYPFDHVAIDRAVHGDRSLFAAMGTGERCEVILTALVRGTGLLELSTLLNWPIANLQELLPDGHPLSRAAEQSQLENVIRAMWARGATDVVISARTGWNPSKIGRIRKRLGLATLTRSNAQKEWAA
jgi:hypothetical protein